MSKNSQKIAAIKSKIKAAQRNILRQIGVEALNHYKDKFTSTGGSWEGKAWEAPKRKTEGPKRRKRGRGYVKGFSQRDATRATLVGRGVLARSLKYRISGAQVTFFSNTPYAKRHNDGLDGMPKRKFMGMERSLRVKIDSIIAQEMSKVKE